MVDVWAVTSRFPRLVPSEVTAAAMDLPARAWRTLALVESTVQHTAALVERMAAAAQNAENLVAAMAETHAEADELVREVREVTRRASDTVAQAAAATVAVEAATRHAEQVTAAVEAATAHAHEVTGEVRLATTSATAVTERSADLTAQVRGLIELYEPLAREAAPSAAELARLMSPEDVRALVERLQALAPDVEQMVERMDNVGSIVEGVPGAKVLRRRGKQADADAD